MFYLYLGLGLVVVSLLTLMYVYHRHILPHLPPDKTKAKPAAPVAPVLTPPTAEELEAQLKSAYERQITAASQELGVNLKATSERLSQQVESLTTRIIEEELGSYQTTLEAVRKVATETAAQIRQAVESEQTELRDTMKKEVDEEHQRLVAQFDTRLGDIVASYVAESLGGGIDLGAQLQYITQTLEANKEALKEDLLR